MFVHIITLYMYYIEESDILPTSMDYMCGVENRMVFNITVVSDLKHTTLVIVLQVQAVYSMC